VASASPCALSRSPALADPRAAVAGAHCPHHHHPEGCIAYSEVPRPGVANARAFVARWRREQQPPTCATCCRRARARASLRGPHVFCQRRWRWRLCGVAGQPDAQAPIEGLRAFAADAGVAQTRCRMCTFALSTRVTLGPARSTPPRRAATSRALLACCGGAAAAPAPAHAQQPGVAPFSFAGKTALVTGCGPGSIAAQLAAAMLGSGAHVIATTSRFSRSSTRHFQALFQASAAERAQLTLLVRAGASAPLLACHARTRTPLHPAPAALQRGQRSSDTADLVAHVYGALRVDLDFIVPFAAVNEAGATADAITGANEVRAHRGRGRSPGPLKHFRMDAPCYPLSSPPSPPSGGAPRHADERAAPAAATSSTRSAARARRATPLCCCCRSRPTTGSSGATDSCVPAPLRPSRAHCSSADPLPLWQYAESKMGLEALCHKWGSEGWGDYVSVAGAVIGWTRGTGLMADNNGARCCVCGGARGSGRSQQPHFTTSHPPCRSRLGGRGGAGLPHLQPGRDGLLPDCAAAPAHGAPGPCSTMGGGGGDGGATLPVGKHPATQGVCGFVGEDPPDQHLHLHTRAPCAAARPRPHPSGRTCAAASTQSLTSRAPSQRRAREIEAEAALARALAAEAAAEARTERAAAACQCQWRRRPSQPRCHAQPRVLPHAAECCAPPGSRGGVRPARHVSRGPLLR